MKQVDTLDPSLDYLTWEVNFIGGAFLHSVFEQELNELMIYDHPLIKIKDDKHLLQLMLKQK